MYCKKCGTEQKPGQKFCLKCGTLYMVVDDNDVSPEVMDVEEERPILPRPVPHRSKIYLKDYNDRSRVGHHHLI